MPRPEVAFPWGSQSIKRVGRPAAARQAAKIHRGGGLAHPTLLIDYGDKPSHGTLWTTSVLDLPPRLLFLVRLRRAAVLLAGWTGLGHGSTSCKVGASRLAAGAGAGRALRLITRSPLVYPLAA